MTTTPPEPVQTPPVPTPPEVEATDPEARYFVIQDPGDAQPWALVAMKPRGLYEMWTGQEWVDMPYFATYFVGGNIGAKAIEPAEVEAYKGVVRQPSEGAVALMRGDGQGVAQPETAPPAPPGPTSGDEESGDTGSGPADEEGDDAEPKAKAEAGPAGQATPPGDDPEAGTGDDPDEQKPKRGKPKKGVNPFPKKGGK